MSPSTRITHAPGTAYWTADGELKSSPNRKPCKRILLGSTKESRLAVRAFERSRRFRCLDIFRRWKYTKIEVNFSESETKTVLVNISSLAKRLNVSVFTILRLSIFGGLSKFVKTRAASVEKQFEKNDAVFAKFQPYFPGKKAFPFIKAAQKTDTLAKGLMATVGREAFVAYQKDEKRDFYLYRQMNVLNRGGYGKVLAAQLLESGKERKEMVVKIATKNPEKPKAEKYLKNEYTILTKIQQKGKPRVRGIQRAPIVVMDLEGIGENIGYLAPRFDYSLDQVTHGKKRLERAEALQCCKDLLAGLSYLHTNKILHGDIKPENACFDKDQFALCDFGGAREKEQIDLIRLLGVHTKPYFSKKDRKQLRKWQLRYCLHMISQNLLGDVEKAWAMGKVRKNKKLNGLKKEEYPLTEQQISKMKDNVYALQVKHDIYSLGWTLVHLLTPKIDKVEDKYAQIEKEYGKEFRKLLEKMCSEEAWERPKLDEVRKALEQLH